MQTRLINHTRERLPRTLLIQAARAVARRYWRSESTVSIVALGERRMRALNAQHRNKAAVTDVLSFFDGEAGYWGEVVICPRQIRRQAKKLNVAYREELLFIVVHGLLHLAGLDDTTERGWREMQREGERLCKKIIAGTG